MNGKKLDAILEFVLQFNGNGIMPDLIKRDLLIDLNTSQIKQLIREIKQLKPEVAVVSEGNVGITICSNQLTKIFLNEGGFTKIESELISEQKALKEKNDLEWEKSKLDLELAKKNLEEFPKIKKRANIGLGIAIVLAIVQLIQWIIELSSKYS